MNVTILMPRNIKCVGLKLLFKESFIYVKDNSFMMGGKHKNGEEKENEKAWKEKNQK